MLGALFEKMAAFELTIRTAVRGYHVYKDSWTPTIGEEFVCRQERRNVHDRHAVAVYGGGDGTLANGQLPREFFHADFFFLEHDGSITRKVTHKQRYCCERGGMEIPCQLTFSWKRKHSKKLKRFFDTHQFSCIEYID